MPSRIAATLAMMLTGTFVVAGPAAAASTCTVTLHPTSFPGGDGGSTPDARLIQGSDGNLYGTTEGQVDLDDPTFNDTPGTIFQLTVGGAVSTTYAFTAVNSDGLFVADPRAGLTAGPGGLLYGTTRNVNGNSWGENGSVFSSTLSGSVSTLYTFPISDPDSNEASPSSELTVGPDGALMYGTTFGTVFSVTAADVVTTLHTFDPATDGTQPNGPLLLGSDGNFYGTTSEGGSGNGGTLFKITPAGAFTVLHSFPAPAADGGGPAGALFQDSEGSLFGEVRGFVNDDGNEIDPGSVFKLTVAGTFSTLYTFSTSHQADGVYPVGGLVKGADGAFYGVTESGGADGRGTIFRLNTAGSLRTVHSFTLGADGGYPLAGLTVAINAKLYGTATSGGTTENGTAYYFSACP